MTRREASSCPVCARPAVARYRPFCSKRCADVDLGRWLEGRYRLPAAEPPEEFDPDAWPPADAPPGDGEGEDGEG